MKKITFKQPSILDFVKNDAFLCNLEDHYGVEIDDCLKSLIEKKGYDNYAAFSQLSTKQKVECALGCDLADAQKDLVIGLAFLVKRAIHLCNTPLPQSYP